MDDFGAGGSSGRAMSPRKFPRNYESRFNFMVKSGGGVELRHVNYRLDKRIFDDNKFWLVAEICIYLF